ARRARAPPGVAAVAPAEPDDAPGPQREEENHRDRPRQLAGDAERVSQERAEADVVILGAAEVLGEEPEGSEPHGGSVRKVPERDRGGDGCGESPVARPPPGGNEDEGIELDQHGGAERDGGAHGGPALAPGRRR